MREYTFLTTEGWRTTHIKAQTLRQAYRMTRKDHTPEQRAKYGDIVPTTYQVCRETDFLMSGWKYSQDKKLKEANL